MANLKFSRNEKLLTFICLIFLVGFLLITILRPSFRSFDVLVSIWIPSIQSSPLTYIAKGIAIVFDTSFLLLLSLVIASYLFLKNRRSESLLLLGAMGGDALLVSVFKNLIESSRPLNGLEFASGFSFPSGHTAGSLVFCGSITYLALQHWKTARSQTSIGIGAVTVTSAVGFSRVYLNVHWFSDVLGAGLLGVFWLSLAVLMFKLLKDNGKFESDRFRMISLPLFVVSVVVAVLIAARSLFT
ncbi:MAG: phosphatase PAP2 family protein [Candidatus Bathyarchaeia archaeon]